MIIYHITGNSWDMQILHELFSTGTHTSLLLSTDPIIPGLINIILVSTYNTSTLQVIYYFNKILKVFFTICNCLTWFHVNLIFHPLHFVIQKLLHIKLSYLLLEINWSWFIGWWRFYNPICHWYNPKFAIRSSIYNSG